VTARDVSDLVVPPTQFAGAPATARSTDAPPCVTRTLHGTALTRSRVSFHLPSSSTRAVPSVAPVAELVSVTVVLAAAVPETASFRSFASH
jgi:hypothetical protein